MDTNSVSSIQIVIGVLGAIAMIGVLWRMRGGFGPQNLRALAIVFIATVAALLAPQKELSSAAMGILGALAGYVFGIRGRPSSADADASKD